MKTKFILAIMALSLSVFGLMSCTEQAENSIPTVNSTYEIKTQSINVISVVENSKNPFDYDGYHTLQALLYYTQKKEYFGDEDTKKFEEVRNIMIEYYSSNNPEGYENPYDVYKEKFSSIDFENVNPNLEGGVISLFPELQSNTSIELFDNITSLVGNYLNLNLNKKDLIEKVKDIENNLVEASNINDIEKECLLRFASRIRYGTQVEDLLPQGEWDEEIDNEPPKPILGFIKAIVEAIAGKKLSPSGDLGGSMICLMGGSYFSPVIGGLAWLLW